MINITDMEDIERLKSSLWERDHPEMEIHEAYTKSTQFTATDYNGENHYKYTSFLPFDL